MSDKSCRAAALSPTMKALVPCTLAALTVGITAGWMLRGGEGGGGASAGPEPKAAKAEERPASGGIATAAAGGGSSGSGEKQKSEIRVPKERDPAKEIFSAADGHLAKIMEDMKEQHAKRSEAKIAALTEKLGLDASQQAKLKDYFDKRNPATTVSKGEDGKGIRIESKMSDSAGSLDDLMKDLLSADQSEKYEEMKATERNQKIEARTLREMASLTQAVELRDDQRQPVYDILEKQAQTDVDGGSALGIGGLMAGAAPVIELADFGGGAAIAGAAVASNVNAMAFSAEGGPEGGNVDHAEVMKQMEQQRQASIDNKVNSLGGVLDASQLAKYRQSLEQGPMLFSR